MNFDINIYFIFKFKYLFMFILNLFNHFMNLKIIYLIIIKKWKKMIWE